MVAFFKMLSMVVAFTAVLLLDLTIKADACRCAYLSVCYGFEVADVVLRGTALSRSEPVEKYGGITYTLELTTLYKGEPDVESGEEISFTTARSTAACGVYLELDEEYLIGLSQSDDGSFRANSCGLGRQWSSVSDEDKVSVEGGCKGGQCSKRCGPFQECLIHSDHLGDESYCADVCDPSPCEDGEKCTLEQLVQCVRAPCPPNAVCKGPKD